VFHLAANIDTGATDDEARVNDAGTRNLLAWLQPVSRGARILYTSSVAVHDRDAQPREAISESSLLVPRTAHGRTKLKGEYILQECGGRDGTRGPFCGCRRFTDRDRSLAASSIS
jgi:nucleoside-diphosphate-sugar epimerase